MLCNRILYFTLNSTKYLKGTLPLVIASQLNIGVKEMTKVDTNVTN